MQIWNGSDEYCWRYRADTILSTDWQTDKVKPVYFVEAGGIITYPNSLWPCDFICHLKTCLFLVLAVACCQFGITLLTEPMMRYWYLNPWAILFRPQCDNTYNLPLLTLLKGFILNFSNQIIGITHQQLSVTWNLKQFSVSHMKPEQFSQSITWNLNLKVPINWKPNHRNSECIKSIYRKVSNISRTLVGNEIVDHSDVVGAAPVGAAPATSSFST